METFLAGLSLQEILILGLVIVAGVFILKKLFKLAFTIVIIIAFVYYGLPVLQTVISK